MANEQLTKLKGGMLRYRYAIDDSGEVAFDFNTLAEVGEPYQQWFKEEIQRRGWTVEFGRDLEEKPYVADFVIGTKEPAERTDLYLPRNSFKVGITYVGDKSDLRRLVGIGREFAPHGATTDKTWVAYELLTPELPNHKGRRKCYSEAGLPVYHCSLNAFRFWARRVANAMEAPAAIQ